MKVIPVLGTEALRVFIENLTELRFVVNHDRLKHEAFGPPQVGG